MSEQNQYGNESIRNLSDREAVRLRVATYAGGDDLSGAFVTVKEIVGNSVDEFKTGHGKELIVRYHKDYFVSVQDFGRGTPVDYNKSENTYNYKLIYLTLNSGGKFNSKNYEWQIGLNGIGCALSIMSSEYADVEVFRDGYKYNIHFEKGLPIGEMLKEEHEYQSTGTMIKWKPDLEVFTENEFPKEWFVDYLKRQAIVNKGLKITFINEHDNTTEEYFYEDGITGYVEDLGKNDNLTDVIFWEAEGSGRDREDRPEYKTKIQVAFTFNNNYPLMESYHNSSFLLHGGSTWNAIKNAFTYAIDKYLQKENKYSKSEKKINFDDIKDSLLIVSNTFSTLTSYQNQTKLAITNKFVQEYMTSFLKEQLEIYFIENKFDAEKIANQIMINKKAKEASEKTRLDLKKKLQSTTSGLSPKNEDLNDCDMDATTLDERWLFLCEGESACSTITSSRDSVTMGTYALRGRFISSLKNSVEDVLNNKPAMGIIQALGCGIEIPKNELKKYKNIDTFDISKLRYGNVVLACDFDGFGHGIALSLLTFFYKFMPTLLKQNRIHLSVSPRYKITVKNDLLFVYNEQEKDELLSKLDKENKKYDVNIVKGLGELNADVYWSYMLNPENRIMKQFIYDEMKENEIEYYFNTLMGEDIDERKKYVKENIVNLNIAEMD